LRKSPSTACVAFTENTILLARPMTVTLESACELHPQVALRPEPFGALAYHYGNRRLVFLRHPDIVRVVSNLSQHTSLRDTLVAVGVAEQRWPSFVTALSSLTTSEIIRVL
jgi:putative mycofactocin binding protein MftB